MRPIVACVVMVLAACRIAPPSLSDADRAAIRALNDSFVANAKMRRDSAVALLFTETGALLPPNGPVVEGRAAIRAWMESFPPMSDFIATDVEVDGRGDLAYVRGTYALTIAGASGRPGTPDRGKYLEILRRQPDGTWLIVADIFNSDLPVPTR